MAPELLVDAFAVSVAPTLAVIANAALNWISAKRAQRDAARSDDKLKQISAVGVATHKIVNNQRTVMTNALAVALETIAKLMPDDEEAQLAAKRARRDADSSI